MNKRAKVNRIIAGLIETEEEYLPDAWLDAVIKELNMKGESHETTKTEVHHQSPKEDKKESVVLEGDAHQRT